MTAIAGRHLVPLVRRPSTLARQDYELLRTRDGSGGAATRRPRVSGADAVDYLQGQLSQDVAALDVGESADSLILTPQGKLDALVRVTRTGDDEFVLDVDGGFGERRGGAPGALQAAGQGRHRASGMALSSPCGVRAPTGGGEHRARGRR